jgi:uncharacterized protein (DUF433 family)
VPLTRNKHTLDIGDYVLRNKPVRQPNQELSTLPTYTIPEAAEALAIPVRTLFAWYSGNKPVLKPSGHYGNMGDLLSFQDLEEAYKVHLLRSQERKYRLSLQYLREAMAEAREKFNSEHPFIDHERDIAVFFEKRRNKLVMSYPGRGRRKRRSVALASPETAAYIPEVVNVWGRRIKSRKQIFPWKFFKTDKTTRPVSIDPEVMSGRLVVMGTRIPVEVLRRRKASGERPEAIAIDYGISVKIVQNALTHIEKNAKKAA